MDKLAEEIFKKHVAGWMLFMTEKGLQNAYKAMQAYHEAKLKEQANNGFSDNDIKAIDSLYENDSTIKISDADIEAYFKTYHNPRIKTADEQYENWLNQYLDELIDSAITGAKAMRDGEILICNKK